MLAFRVSYTKLAVARLVVFTGGKEPGDRYTEGGSGAHWAEQRGVPASAAVIEDQSRTTYQNLAGTRRLLQVSFNASIFKDPTGSVRGIFASARDACSWKKAAQGNPAGAMVSRQAFAAVDIETTGKGRDR